jgi:ribulose-phosphate 3-epimerase
MLSADHGRMIEEVKRVESWGATWLHIDIMDGHFAPNLTFGPGLVKSIRPAVRSTIDCHLMLSNPEDFASRFFDAGADSITVHAEATTNETLLSISSEAQKRGKKLGVAFKPSTPIFSVDLSPVEISMVLVMTVNPGFSGQKFMPQAVPKIGEASNLFSDKNVEIQVDGGVDVQNASLLAKSGATVLVAGNSIFSNSNPEKAFKDLTSAAGSSV